MKSFSQLREKKSPKGEVVVDKKIKRISMKIIKDNKGFSVYIDGDFLDTFKSKSEAEKTANTVIKELS
jgi:hypothetical protein